MRIRCKLLALFACTILGSSHCKADFANLYVAIDGNYSNDGSGSIYSYNSSGVQSTYATGLNYPNALTFDTAGNLYVVEQFTNDILKYTPSGAKSTFVVD